MDTDIHRHRRDRSVFPSLLSSFSARDGVAVSLHRFLERHAAFPFDSLGYSFLATFFLFTRDANESSSLPSFPSPSRLLASLALLRLWEIDNWSKLTGKETK